MNKFFKKIILEKGRYFSHFIYIYCYYIYYKIEKLSNSNKKYYGNTRNKKRKYIVNSWTDV